MKRSLEKGFSNGEPLLVGSLSARGSGVDVSEIPFVQAAGGRTVPPPLMKNGETEMHSSRNDVATAMEDDDATTANSATEAESAATGPGRHR